MNVRELIELLLHFPMDAKVVFGDNVRQDEGVVSVSAESKTVRLE